MDPQATLAEILEILAQAYADDSIDSETKDRLDELTESLAEWVDRGGYLPADLQSVAADLEWNAAEYAEEIGEEGLEFRLYLRGGSVVLNTGDSSYDQDHRGYIGSGWIVPKATAEDAAAAVWQAYDEAIDHFYSVL